MNPHWSKNLPGLLYVCDCYINLFTIMHGKRLVSHITSFQELLMLPNYEVLLMDARFLLLGVTLVWVVNNHPFLLRKQTKKNRAIELCDIKSPAVRMCFGQHAPDLGIITWSCRYTYAKQIC